jgi:sterol 3beta-glucosyltransferase
MKWQLPLIFYLPASSLAQVREIIFSVWGACTEPDPGEDGSGSSSAAPGFVAEAIVANPAAFGASFCAEKLNIPMHSIFTMPWTPTQVGSI